MKNKHPGSKSKGAAEAAMDSEVRGCVEQAKVPEPEGFLAEAIKEPKRKLLSDHLKTITTLRDEKRFTFRDIADWFNKRGFETDHSAVYRAYLSNIPEEQRDPNEDWSDVKLAE